MSGQGADDGRPDPQLAGAVTAWRAAPDLAARAEVLAALAGARVFLALAARAHSGGAEMALLSVARSDGARALPAFADGHAVQRWRAEARPVPVPGRQACLTALSDGAEAILLDPHDAVFVVGRQELTALAEGRVPVAGSPLSARRTRGQFGPPVERADPALLAALARALDHEPVAAARWLEGPDGPALGVVPSSPLDPAAQAGLAARVARRLGPLLPADGLDLVVVGERGPGQLLPLRR